MPTKLKILLSGIALLAISGHVAAQITFYEHERFGGRSFTSQGQLKNLQRKDFDEMASSVVVSGRDWELCEQQNYGGRCVILRPGNYLSLSSMGLNERISSARPLTPGRRLDNSNYGPPPSTVYDARRRGNERLFEAEVTSVHAVMRQEKQRCWVEQREGPHSDSNVPASLMGALIGGVLGHQVGNGRGRDLATAGGAVAGAVVGSNLASERSSPMQNVEHCTQQGDNRSPEYWDVGYRFGGQEHRIQMNSAPGRTIIVNRQGEPRT